MSYIIKNSQGKILTYISETFASTGWADCFGDKAVIFTKRIHAERYLEVMNASVVTPPMLPLSIIDTEEPEIIEDDSNDLSEIEKADIIDALDCLLSRSYRLMADAIEVSNGFSTRHYADKIARIIELKKKFK